MQARALVIALVSAAVVLPGMAGSAPDCSSRPFEIVEGPPGDHTSDAAGFGQIFERVAVPGITDAVMNTQGVGLVDLDRDGRVDIVRVHSSRGPELFRNRECFDFTPHNLVVEGGRGPGPRYIPAFADFNDDGFLDFYLSASSWSARSDLLLSQDAYDRFIDHAVPMGVGNDGAYVHGQVSPIDVNGDGWLDLAIGANQIGQGAFSSGRPLTRLYVYEPAASGVFEEGRFIDAGGTDTVPGFGGMSKDECNTETDYAGSSLVVRDMDDDGDLDLFQPTQNDMLAATANHPCATGPWKFGMFLWKSLLADTGEFRFHRLAPGEGGIAQEGRMRYDDTLRQWVPVERAQHGLVGNMADIDNDGDLDVISVVATDLEWHVHSEQVTTKLWRNLGGFEFEEATDEAGLGAMNWNYGEWQSFWGTVMAPHSRLQALACSQSTQIPRCATLTTYDHQFMSGGTVFFDMENDGDLDLLYIDRHDVEEFYKDTRNVLFRNRGDGTFELLTTEISGIDTNSMSAEAADLDGDGLLDLYIIKSPGNSTGEGAIALATGAQTDDRFEDVVYWNTGLEGGAANHWIRVRLTGLPQRKLVGARIFAHDGETGELLGRRDLFPAQSYKATVELLAHFGLGRHESVDLRVILPGPGGEEIVFEDVPIDTEVNADVVAHTAIAFVPEPIDGDPVPELRTERVYFHCHGSTNAAQVSRIEEGPIPWNPNPPTGTFANGEICYAADPGGASNAPAGTNLVDAVFEGTFTGNLDSLTVHAHTNTSAYRVPTTPFTARVGLAIDGIDSVPLGTEVTVTPKPGNQITEVIEFSVTGLGFVGSAHTGSHRVTLTLDSAETNPSLWTYDGTNTQSGITFNPEQPDAAQTPAANRP